jgi:hypothetical protein
VIVISALMNLAAASYCGRTRETVTNFASTVLCVSTSSSCRCDVALCPLAEIDGAETESGHSGKADHKV